MNTYGQLSNAELLHMYGFTETGNPNDEVRLVMWYVMGFIWCNTSWGSSEMSVYLCTQAVINVRLLKKVYLLLSSNNAASLVNTNPSYYCLLIMEGYSTDLLWWCQCTGPGADYWWERWTGYQLACSHSTVMLQTNGWITGRLATTFSGRVFIRRTFLSADVSSVHCPLIIML